MENINLRTDQEVFMLYDILKYVFVGAAIVMIIIGIVMKSSKSKKTKPNFRAREMKKIPGVFNATRA